MHVNLNYEHTMINTKIPKSTTNLTWALFNTTNKQIKLSVFANFFEQTSMKMWNFMSCSLLFNAKYDGQW